MPKGDDNRKGPRPVRKKLGSNGRTRPQEDSVRVRRGAYYGEGTATAATTKNAYTPKSCIPGVRHVIEGRTDLQYKLPGRSYELSGMARDAKGYTPSKEYRVSRKSKMEGRAAKRENAAVDEQIKGFGLIDQARSRLRTIPDADAAETEERKKAARRRMRGRFGTMLSGQRETLG